MRITKLLPLLFLMVFTMPAAAQNLHDFSLQGMDGKPLPLKQYAGKVVLLVNTASECGYTPQYEGLEKLWEAYKDKGLVVVGVPSNDFGGQEPGKAAEIATFCKVNYGVTFPLSDKTVVSGQGEAEVYKWAADKAGMLGTPKWNFHKYLFSKSGEFVDWFSTPTEPMSAKITAAVETELSKK
jgi:glutathione peroxidase